MNHRVLTAVCAACAVCQATGGGGAGEAKEAAQIVQGRGEPGKTDAARGGEEQGGGAREGRYGGTVHAHILNNAIWYVI